MELKKKKKGSEQWLQSESKKKRKENEEEIKTRKFFVKLFLRLDSKPDSETLSFTFLSKEYQKNHLIDLF